MLLLDIVVASGDKADNEDGDEDRQAIDPAEGDAILPDTDGKGDESCHNQNLKDCVLKVLLEHVPDGTHFPGLSKVVAIPIE